MHEIIVTEGFYTDPLQMKTLFSTLEYEKNENELQGQICPMTFANEDMLRQMEYITNAPEGVYEFIEGSGSFIINQKNDIPLQKVGTNYPDLMTQWIGLVCLSETKEPHFLKFYRHKRTGWDGVPKNREEIEKESINNYDEFQQFIARENENESNWEETTRIEFGFNKLILFRPGLFHSYSDVYGDSKETGRLLQFFFLKQKIQEEAEQ